MSVTRWFAAALAALVLTGCATAPPKAFDRQAMGEIKRGAIVQFPGPDQFSVVGAAQIPGSFMLGVLGGAIGGAIAGGIEAARASAQASSLTTGMNQRAADATRRFYDTLAAKLAARGFEVVRVDEAEKKSIDTVQDYSARAPGAQVAIEVIPTAWGYGRFEGGLHPWVGAQVQFVGIPGAPVHFTRTIVYGKGAGATVEWLQPDPRFSVADDLDTLYASGPLAVEGVRTGIEKLAEHIASRL